MCKISRRDFPLVLSRQLSGGTTVAGTLVVASMLGPLPIFVTGGIGGVHRGGQDTMDVSADLIELGRSSTAVISAGIKSILDIGRTLEQLVGDLSPELDWF
jgi:pseudouridine-5'-phosphate glycosidase